MENALKHVASIMTLIIYIIYMYMTIKYILIGFQPQTCGLFMTWTVHHGGGAQLGRTS